MAFLEFLPWREGYSLMLRLQHDLLLEGLGFFQLHFGSALHPSIYCLLFLAGHGADMSPICCQLMTESPAGDTKMTRTQHFSVRIFGQLPLTSTVPEVLPPPPLNHGNPQPTPHVSPLSILFDCCIVIGILF